MSKIFILANKIKNRYIQGIIIVSIIIVLGLLVELLTGGQGVSMPQWPLNIIILSIFVVYIILLHFFWKSEIKAWLSSVPTTVTAIGAYAFVVILMGFIPQIDKSEPNWIRLIGLSHIHRSWEFLFLSIYLLIILGLVILRRLKKMDFRNITFLLNHLGIFIVISAASVGTGDLQRLTLPLYSGQASNYAYKDKTTLKKLPFTIKLDTFKIEYYVPQMIIFNPHSRQIYNEPGIDYSIATGKKIKYKNWTFTVRKYYRNAIRKDSIFIEKDTAKSEFAALVNIKNKQFSRTVWISSGNYHFPSMSADFSKDLAISLSLPEDKKYISIIDLADNKGQSTKNIKILVNHPFKYKGYTIYQQGFDNKAYPGVNVSILELVRDPWLPVVYVGLIMLLIGATLLFWLGKNDK